MIAVLSRGRKRVEEVEEKNSAKDDHRWKKASCMLERERYAAAAEATTKNHLEPKGPVCKVVIQDVPHSVVRLKILQTSHSVSSIQRRKSGNRHFLSYAEDPFPFFAKWKKKKANQQQKNP